MLRVWIQRNTTPHFEFQNTIKRNQESYFLCLTSAKSTKWRGRGRVYMAYPHPQNRNLKRKRRWGAAKVTSYVVYQFNWPRSTQPGGGGWVRQLTSGVPPYPSLAKKHGWGECWDIAASILQPIQTSTRTQGGEKTTSFYLPAPFPLTKTRTQGLRENNLLYLVPRERNSTRSYHLGKNWVL